MKMSDIKVGMKLRSMADYTNTPIITVTELTEQGFKYTHEKRTIKIGNPGGVPQFGTVEGGEHYGFNGECWVYEPVEKDYRNE